MLKAVLRDPQIVDSVGEVDFEQSKVMLNYMHVTSWSGGHLIFG
jgi:hypothetical protein